MPCLGPVHLHLLEAGPPMKALVTGGSGFIGSALVRCLIERGHSVVVLDNLSSGCLENLAGLSEVKFIQGDIRDSDILSKAVDGAEVIFHMAAHLAHASSLREPLLNAEVNVLGTVRVLEAARQKGVSKIVFSSSTAVYGEAVCLPIDESHPLQPQSPYGVNKLAAEKHCLCYSSVYGLDTVCLRYFNVYGLRQRADVYGAVIPSFLSSLLKDEPLIIYEDGEQTRDFVHVSDVALANIQAAEAIGVRGVFNIASGESTSINHLADLIQNISGKKMEIRYEQARKGDVRHASADISNARAVLGYRPSIGIAEGIAGLMP